MPVITPEMKRSQQLNYEVLDLVQRGIEYYKRVMPEVRLFKVVMPEIITGDLSARDFQGVEYAVHRGDIELHFAGLAKDRHIAIYPVPDHLLKAFAKE